ncbi:MAG: aminopeptidase N [Alteromonadaceae bacterium]|uniref:aminopeptidase N n=1 Tax=Rheinheimera aquimaris TaxID=412437 RepID=UPI000C584B17|nr:aminopeptidase N [Rheinheimera aquimaris]MBJ91767.1 aminopeptidase N [Alteromonadaceae bacterium]MCD1599504.1 aminopeptidase N [Rheinheimera aquimaris]
MATDQQNRQAKSRHDYQPPAFLIPTIDLHFELDSAATVVSSVMQLRRQTAGAALKLDGQHLKLLQVLIDGKQLSDAQYDLSSESLTIPDVPDTFELKIVTQIAPVENTALEGLYMAGNSYCTQCEAEGFRRISYFLDRPDVLSEYRVTIKADAVSYPYLLSNGNKIAEHITADGSRIVQWHDPFPKPCYLFALVAGDYDLLEDSFITASGREVALQLFVDKGQAHRGDFALQALKRAMRWDEQRFNLEYDLDIYMIVATDFFNMGAMENKGLNVFNSKYVLAETATATDRDYFNIESIIGHEYFHNWTGNRVTCRDWFQLSLKEGLTVFRDQEFSADMGSATLCRIDAVKLIRTAQFAEDASPMAHPIRPESVLEMNNFYTVTVYDKGAEVIRMLQTILGKEGFAQGMALYLKRHDGQAATCDDFIQAMQDANGYDLTHFTLWYSQSGTAQVNVSQQYDTVRQTLTLALSQHTAATADQTEKQALQIPVRIELLLDGGEKQSHLLMLTEKEQTFIFSNIGNEPVVVWLEHFSAPVKLQQQSSDEALLHIAACATDGVARWDAMQQFWSRKVAEVIAGKNAQDVLPPKLFQMMQSWLRNPEGDKALIAELLSLPDFETLAEQYEQIPVDGILSALEQFRQIIADRLQSDFVSCYQQVPVSAYQYDEASVGNRRLRALCLGYIAFQHNSQQLLQAHYHQADNMSDTIAALMASQQAQTDTFKALLADFSQRWNSDVLVMDKAFGLAATQPSEQVFTSIEEMQSHPLFSWKNPNRVRALFSAFSMRNPRQFHSADGKGYQLLQYAVAKMDAINPQVAARLITPLLSWRRYDESRQQAMRNVLQVLADSSSLSNDVFEKVSRSLS